jgi:hypothetical protein
MGCTDVQRRTFIRYDVCSDGVLNRGKGSISTMLFIVAYTLLLVNITLI